MTEGKEVSVSKCPVELEVCFPTCYFWRSGKCQYGKVARSSSPISSPRRHNSSCLVSREVLSC